jgi:pimeloyl-ACP methyl ester carboxylesterase
MLGARAPLQRGPLLIIFGEKDNTVPWAIANASYKKQQRSEGVTEIVEIRGRGHALTIDNGHLRPALRRMGTGVGWARWNPASRR